MKSRTRICIGVVAIAIASGIPWVLHARKMTQRNECLNCLRMLTGPMACCVPLSMNLTNGDKMEPRAVLEFFKGGKLPSCPAGGEYIVSWIVGGPTPKCSLHGDLLWEVDHVKTLEELEDWHAESKETQPASAGGSATRAARVQEPPGK